MNTIIAGLGDGVTFKDVLTAVRDCGWKVTGVVSATALGAKTEGEKVAKLLGVPINLYPTDLAGVIKSEVMTNNAEALIVVRHGRDKGTEGMIDIARKKGLKVYVHPVKELISEVKKQRSRDNGMEM